ncbi:hypothetical protein CRG98_032430 [Punica granatum]|uniref:Uncharacterized protein n=1 Tax=Punica granatum TaxID=22663 RepID=A0A2I0IT76_PUNGR|nr:hypothetical protein CRG98_032430 [Punica granatum]
MAIKCRHPHFGPSALRQDINKALDSRFQNSNKNAEGNKLDFAAHTIDPEDLPVLFCSLPNLTFLFSSFPFSASILLQQAAAAHPQAPLLERVRTDEKRQNRRWGDPQLVGPTHPSPQLRKTRPQLTRPALSSAQNPQRTLSSTPSTALKLPLSLEKMEPSADSGFFSGLPSCRPSAHKPCSQLILISSPSSYRSLSFSSTLSSLPLNSQLVHGQTDIAIFLIPSHSLTLLPSILLESPSPVPSILLPWTCFSFQHCHHLHSFSFLLPAVV